MKPVGVQESAVAVPNENSKRASLSVSAICGHVVTAPPISVSVAL